MRCSICDTVNNPFLANLPDKYKASQHRGYYPDPDNKQNNICQKCYTEYKKNLRELKRNQKDEYERSIEEFREYPYVPQG